MEVTPWISLAPSETVLAGQWVLKNDRVTPDDVCKRIMDLTGTVLVEMDRDPSGWDVLYRDPGDGRLWELTHPQSERAGGGPPQLKVITGQDAQRKYRASL
ncbi:Imm27 family immunity protein [Nitrospirillum sp. BR 11164]|uniref:Imm27 family immunity protein n=1 Tax=Nitrospirillum sp. BR 11164 TaxID=3104324 RepID=UPI002AFF157C|nr:Imm27 family immunity protein [Nitrospirillum sp. BR 11164]MEA1650006.1 Imm27 family immunity protein [Nitrospirillum sp. BR 11164]